MNQLSNISSTVINQALFNSLTANRVSNFSISAPYSEFLRTRQPLRVMMSDGTFSSFAALNTDTSTARLSSYDLKPLISSLKSFKSSSSSSKNKKESFLVVSTTADNATPTVSTTMSSMITPPATPLSKDQLVAYPYFEYSSAFVSYASQILPPTNQYLCGCCWALCTATGVSDSFVVSGITPTNPNLSFTWNLACFPSCPSTDNSCLNSNPTASVQCGGGNYADLAKWLMTNGIASNSCIDYSWCSGSGDCNSTTPPSSEDALNSLIPSCGCTTAGSFPMYMVQNVNSLVLTEQQASDPTALAAIQHKIKEHLVNVGPVLVGLLVFSNFMSGTYQSTDHPEYNPSNVYLEYVGNLNEPSATLAEFQGAHALCIVGWGTFPIKATLLPSSVQSSLTIDSNGFVNILCWKIRNSWGPAWCNQGHVYIASYPYNTTVCVEVSATFTDPNNNSTKTGGMVIFEPLPTINNKDVKASTSSSSSSSTESPPPTTEGTTPTTPTEGASPPPTPTEGATPTTPAEGATPTTPTEGATPTTPAEASTNATLSQVSQRSSLAFIPKSSSSSSLSSSVQHHNIKSPSPSPSSSPSSISLQTSIPSYPNNRIILSSFSSKGWRSLSKYSKVFLLTGIVGIILFIIGIVCILTSSS
jgi:hypothetical protein